MRARNYIVSSLLMSGLFVLQSIATGDSSESSGIIIPGESLVMSTIDSSTQESPSSVRAALGQYLSYLESQGSAADMSYDMLCRLANLFDQYIPKKDQQLFYSKLDVIMDLYPPQSETDQQEMKAIVSLKERHLLWMTNNKLANEWVGAQQEAFEKAALMFVRELLSKQNINYGRLESLRIAERVLGFEYVYYPERANLLKVECILTTPGPRDEERNKELCAVLDKVNVSDEIQNDIKALVLMAEGLVGHYQAVGKQDSDECRALSRFLGRVEGTVQ